MSATDTDAALTALARACGIADHYWDARGERFHPSSDTLRHLLHAMRVLHSREADGEAIASALETERGAAWARTLPPVRVLRSGDPTGIELVVPDDALEQRWQWRLHAEHGEPLSAEFTPTELDLSTDEGGEPDTAHGHRQGVAVQRRWLALPEVAEGYHHLAISRTGHAPLPGTAARLIVAPHRCQDTHGPRAWGPATQLYALRSARNQGLGDFSDLASLCRHFATLDADLVGINPLHALFAHDPEQASPYSPSSRLFLNPQYIALDAVPGHATLEQTLREHEDERKACLGVDFIDWSRVAALSSSALEALHAHALATDDESLAAFADWRAAAGEPLERFALFEALRERNAASTTEPTSAWWDWPDGLDDPESPASARAAIERADRVTYHAWLQWLAATQLDAAAEAASQAGMRIGLYQDLAVGTAAGGSDAWAAQSAYLRGIGVGAPPDDFSASGQNWGLPPLDPRALREQGYEPFAQMLRANMRASGAVRIDHVMGLARLFWIPEGASPVEGAYVSYPLDDMLAVLALESRRAGCLVIGEDLGTVPEGFRERLAEAGVLSYKLMYFEKAYDGDQGFIAPSDYAANSLVGANTHDLPTLRGWWQERDLTLRDELGLMPSAEFVQAQRVERRADKRRLLDTMQHVGALPPGTSAAQADEIDMDDELVAAVHAFIARSPSHLLVANLEDMVGQVEQMNLPGTDRDVYPNWRRRLHVPIEAMAGHAGIDAVAAAIREQR